AVSRNHEVAMQHAPGYGADREQCRFERVVPAHRLRRRRDGDDLHARAGNQQVPGRQLEQPILPSNRLDDDAPGGAVMAWSVAHRAEIALKLLDWIEVRRTRRRTAFRAAGHEDV